MQKQSYELIKHLGTDNKLHTIILRKSQWKPFFFLFVNFLVLAKCLRHRRIRVIHANDGLMALVLAPLLLVFPRRLSVTLHGLDAVNQFPGYRRSLHWILRRYGSVITVSRALHAICLERGLAPDRTHFVPNGFERKELATAIPSRASDMPLLVSVGRPIERKGFTWFIKNVLALLPCPTRYVIVCSGHKHRRLTHRIRRLLPGRAGDAFLKAMGVCLELEALQALAGAPPGQLTLELQENLTLEALDSLVASADLLIMPNLAVAGDFEGFGLVALEAVSLGTVPLAARVDGIPSALDDGKNGILLASGDPAVWIHKLNALFADLEEVRRMGLNFRDYTHHHKKSWSAIADDYLEVFCTCH